MGKLRIRINLFLVERLISRSGRAKDRHSLEKSIKKNIEKKINANFLFYMKFIWMNGFSFSRSLYSLKIKSESVEKVQDDIFFIDFSGNCDCVCYFPEIRWSTKGKSILMHGFTVKRNFS